MIRHIQKGLKERNRFVATLYLLVILGLSLFYQIKLHDEIGRRNLISPLASDARLLVPARAETSRLDSEVSEAKEKEIKVEDTTFELIHFYSEMYGVDEAQVICILLNESHFDPYAVGDNGKAKGMAQFWLSTWKRIRKAMGVSQQDLRTDKAEAIKTLCWALANGYGPEWSTYWRCK